MHFSHLKNLFRDSDKSILLDDTLQIIVQHFLMDAQFPINTMVQKVSAAMTRTVLVQTRDGKQIVHRGKAPSIELKVKIA